MEAHRSLRAIVVVVAAAAAAADTVQETKKSVQETKTSVQKELTLHRTPFLDKQDEQEEDHYRTYCLEINLVQKSMAPVEARNSTSVGAAEH